ncbi:MAG: class I SAM-dependent methyltransferase [Verrucomicrobia bacterium]|nr:class I SAM-dependent methyltransferase [Verrucomicrobiota bacterium]
MFQRPALGAAWPAPGGRGAVFDPADHNYPRFAQAVREMAGECKRVADFGTPARFNKALAPFAGLFHGNYQAFAGPGGEEVARRGVVDGICDLQKLDFPDGHFDGVICLSVLEHVPKMWVAAQEIQRVLASGGRLLVSVPWVHPFHEGGNTPAQDFWRVSRRGAEILFEGCRSLEVIEYDGWATSLAKLMPRGGSAFANTRPGRLLLNRLDRLARQHTSNILVVGRK